MTVHRTPDDSSLASAIEEIKPCPFCGGEPLLEEYDGKHGYDEYFSLGCNNANCAGHRVYDAWALKHKAECLAAWNRRDTPSQSRQREPWTKEKRERAIALLQSWIDEPATEQDRKEWEEFVAACPEIFARSSIEAPTTGERAVTFGEWWDEQNDDAFILPSHAIKGWAWKAWNAALDSLGTPSAIAEPMGQRVTEQLQERDAMMPPGILKRIYDRQLLTQDINYLYALFALLWPAGSGTVGGSNSRTDRTGRT